MFIWNDPSTNLAGQNAGLQIWIGANPTATPGADDAVAQTIHVDDLGGRGPLWGINIDAQQQLGGGWLIQTTTGNLHSNTTLDNVANTTGIIIGLTVTGTGIPDRTYVSNIVGSTITLSQAATVTSSGVSVRFNRPGIVRGIELNVIANNTLGSDATTSYPTGAAVWAYEAVASAGSSTNPLAAFRVDAAADTSVEWFSYGMTMRRALKAGVTFENASGDVNNSFQTALLWQRSGITPAFIRLDGTVTTAIDATLATLANALKTGTFTLTAAGVMSASAGAGGHQFSVNAADGEDAGIQYQSAGIAKWTNGRDVTTHNFFWYNNVTALTALKLLSASPTSGNSSLQMQYHNGATVTLQTVSLGIADSGGAGFKLLRVPN